MCWCVRASLLCPKWGDKGGAESLMSSLTGRIHVSLFLPANTCCSGRGKIHPTLHATHTNGRMRQSEKERKGVYQTQEDMSGGHSALVAFERNAATIIRVNLCMLISSACRFTGGKYKGENIKLKTALNLYWCAGLVLILRAMVRSSLVWGNRHDTIRYDSIWFGIIWYDTIQHTLFSRTVKNEDRDSISYGFFFWQAFRSSDMDGWGLISQSHSAPENLWVTPKGSPVSLD